MKINEFHVEIFNSLIQRFPEHPEHNISDKTITIWRYMEYWKFCNLINTKSLFFPRANCLGDTYEGSWPEKALDNYLENLRKMLRSYINNPDSDNSYDLMIEEIIHIRKLTILSERNRLFISCWHINDCEFPRMWESYGKEETSIAIKTTYSKLYKTSRSGLIDSLNQGDIPITGKVNYLDYKKSEKELEFFTPFLTKRKSLKWENEVRVLIYRDTGDPPLDGIPISITPKDIIESIYTSPNSPEGFHQSVITLSKNVGIPEERIHKSSLSANPHN